MYLPRIIQGGMGIGVSGWRLASAVSSAGQLGVVSGICLDELLVRRLQLGDPEGHVRRALSHFPIKEIAQKIIDNFFKEKGKGEKESYIPIKNLTIAEDKDREDLLVAGGFTEVFLAKEGHSGLVGVNLLEKIQLDCLPTLYGCMLAGVDFVTMGAGIPREIPGCLDRLSKNLIASFKLTVSNASNIDFKSIFDPSRFKQTVLKRPKFLAIVSSVVLAATLLKKSTGSVDGFIVESPIAGGHNAPPRGEKIYTPSGEPVYGSKDEVDFNKMKSLGVPFWVAGGYGFKGKLKEAEALGATGIQVGTPFIVTKESGLSDEMKKLILKSDRKVFTDPNASPTGFPFKCVQLDGTLSERSIFEARPRICNLGYLTEKYVKNDGSIGFRCPAEPIQAYVAKGGDEERAKNSKCLCNALFANIGLANSYKNGYTEQPLITAGDSLESLDYLHEGMSAKEVIDYLLTD